MSTKAKFLVLVTIGLLLFTISAFSMAITKQQIEILPFAVLSLILLFIFKKELKRA